MGSTSANPFCEGVLFPVVTAGQAKPPGPSEPGASLSSRTGFASFRASLFYCWGFFLFGFLWLSAHLSQRVCPGMGALEHDLHSPCSKCLWVRFRLKRRLYSFRSGRWDLVLSYALRVCSLSSGVSVVALLLPFGSFGRGWAAFRGAPLVRLLCFPSFCFFELVLGLPGFGPGRFLLRLMTKEGSKVRSLKYPA